MAGAFGGDDNEFEDYYPEIDDEQEEDDGADEEEYPDWDDGELEPDVEENVNAIKKKLMEQEEQRLKPKLKKLNNALNSRQLPYFLPWEKKTLEKAKKHNNLKKQVKEIYLKFNTIKVKLSSKVFSTIAPILPYILIGGLILLAVCVIVYTVASLMPWLFPNDSTTDGGGGSGGTSAQFGVNGASFYGVRTIYKNDELARTSLLENYSNIIEEVRDNVLTLSKTITRNESDGSGGTIAKTYIVSVNVDLSELSTEEDGVVTEFDFSSFNETTFSSTYYDYHTLLNNLTSVVYKADNAEATVPTTIVEKLDLIKYFGLDGTMINLTETDTLTDDFDDVILKYFQNNFSIQVKDSEGNLASITLDESEKFTSNQVKTKVDEILSRLDLIRSEKLFIKDYVFESESDMMKNIAEENYVAWMFMPKTNVNFSKFSFSITHGDFDNFEFNLFNNGNEINLTKDNFNWADTGSEDSSTPTYTYVADNVSVSASTFADINTNNLNELADGVSFAEIIRNNSINSDYYLTLNTDGFYTYKTSGVYLTFESDIKFSCVEFETIWE